MSQLPKPKDLVPHREPFLFLDEVTSIDPGERATGRWKLTGDEDFFRGHFPGRPTLPGVLMVESIAQLGVVVVLSDDRFAGKLPLFGGVDNVRFRRQVDPGDVLELTIEMTRLTSRGGRGSGRAEVNGELACQADLLFIVVDA